MKTSSTILIALLMAPCVGACDDEPPPGMIDALTHGLAGKLLGCPHDKCTGVREINIALTDTADTLKTKADNLTKSWCPTYGFTSEVLAKNKEGNFSRNKNYSVKVVGFGEISVTTEDYEAEIELEENGWKTSLTHSHEAGTGTCAPDWPVQQCLAETEVEVKSDGEISISWIAGTETKSASGKGSEYVKFSAASSQSWCEKRKHDEEFDSRSCAGTAVEDDGGSLDLRCTTAADCAELPCGEWNCEDGECKQLEAAPDGTACEGGTCASGKCVKE